MREPGLSGYEAELAETWQMLSFYGREFGLMGGVGPLRIEAVLALLEAKGFGEEELRLVLKLDQIIYPSLLEEGASEDA
ncbi:MAG: hypothetical protein RRB13_02660 [bacterium]|nr:hypothetical protein [bacterium]